MTRAHRFCSTPSSPSGSDADDPLDRPQLAHPPCCNIGDRLRLIASELIESTSHGYVDFALPYLRDYLREHAAAAGLRP